jgi:hypothetical protein
MESLESQTKIVFEANEVAYRLTELAVKEGDMQGAAEYGMRNALQCTLHDPPMLPGLMAWGKTIRFLRDQLVPLGWVPDNTKNYSTIGNAKKGVAIAASAGDAWTGKHGPNQNPSTRNPKGTETKRAIGNNQLHFFEISQSFPQPQQASGVETWLLLYYWDEEAEEIRVELSLPREMNDQGYVNRWSTRIILAPVPLMSGPAAQDVPADDEGETDIEVSELG